MGRQRVGLQLYSMRELTKQDLPGVLEQAARIGYEGVEFAGLFGNSPAAIRKVLHRLGLTAVGAHIGLEDLEQRLDETVGDLRDLGCDTAIVAWLPPELYADEATATSTVQRLVAAGQAVRSADLKFAYHNHDFEFGRIDQTTLWELLLEASPDALPLEVDVYWVRYAGLEPATLLRELGSRVVLIHAKDTAPDGASDCAVGQGIEPWPEILAASRDAGVEWLVVEQEESSDIAADVASSLRYLRGLLG